MIGKLAQKQLKLLLELGQFLDSRLLASSDSLLEIYDLLLLCFIFHFEVFYLRIFLLELRLNFKQILLHRNFVARIKLQDYTVLARMSAHGWPALLLATLLTVVYNS